MFTKKAFSLIEIIIATGILTITVFGIYKLIGENNKIVSNSNNFLNQNIVFENTKECLKGKNFTEKKFLDFGEDLKKCNFGNIEKLSKIDGVEYIISVEEIKNKWKIKIESNVIGVIEKEIEK